MAVSTRHLLDAAARVLAQHPDASLQQIAEAAGVSRTTLFYRFASRELLLQALAVDVLSQLEAGLGSVAWDSQDIPATIRAVAAALMPLAPRIQVTLREGARQTSSAVAALWTDALQPLTGFITTCQRQRRLRTDQDQTWLTWTLVYLMFAGWDAVSAGLMSQDQAVQLVAQTWGSGAVSGA